MKVKDTLKWLLFGTGAFGTEEKVDISELLTFVHYHKLHKVLLRKVSEPDCGWCDVKLLERLTEMDTLLEKHVVNHLTIAQQLIQRMEADNNLPIVLKGFSTYALTGHKEHLRISRDLDLFVENVDRALATFQSLGFDISIYGDNWHEIQATRGEVLVEVHKYFPVLSYPMDIFEESLEPATNTGIWKQAPRPYPITKIYHKHAKEHSQQCNLEGLGDFRVVDTHLAILIRCAHMLDGFTQITSTIQLSELFEIYALINSPSYQKTICRELMLQFGAYDALRFVDECFHYFFDEHLFDFPELQYSSQKRPQFPICLASRFWLNLSSFEESIFPRNYEFVFAKMGQNQINATDERTYSTGLMEGTTQLARIFMTSNLAHYPPPITLSVTWTQEQLAFVFNLWADENSRTYFFHIHCADRRIYSACKISFDKDILACDTDDYRTEKNSASVAYHDRNYTVEMIFRDPIVLQELATYKSVLFFVHIVMNIDASDECFIIIPLKIEID